MTLDIDQATKPLPQLPRGWSRVCHEIGLFLRSIGLGILVTSFQGFFTNNFLEPEKVAIHQSRVTALLRALIHLLPLGLAIFEIVLNWRCHYVGAIFDKQNYLQFAAKAHEILIQASMTTIVLSYTRYQISAGNGMPFGAVLGSLQFSQVSYLWSVEFWSAIVSKDFQPRRKICFAILIVTCIVVAATAGPSSANLLIARQGIWPRKSNYLAVNATFQNIWPDDLDDEYFPSHCKTTRIDDPAKGCPISSLKFTEDLYTFTEMLRSYRTNTLQSLGVQNLASYYERSMRIAACFSITRDQVCATIPQNAFLEGLIVDAQAHFQEEVDMALEGYHTLTGDYQQPYTTATCVTDDVQTSADQAPLQFPRLSETASELKRDRQTFPVTGLTKGRSTYNIAGNISQFRVDWVDLPSEIFKTRVPGAIIVHPQSSSNLSYNITTCTLNTRHALSTQAGALLRLLLIPVTLTSSIAT